jgi:hypothetical protein
MPMIALLLALSSAGQIEHHVRVDHANGGAEVAYRPHVAIDYRQIGTAAAPGRPSSLACAWRANVSVERTARHAGGSVLRRTTGQSEWTKGHLPGWCSAHRAAIARTVARKTQGLREHLLGVAREDHPVLGRELDQLPVKKSG